MRPDQAAIAALPLCAEARPDVPAVATRLQSIRLAAERPLRCQLEACRGGPDAEHLARRAGANRPELDVVVVRSRDGRPRQERRLCQLCPILRVDEIRA